MLVKRTITAAAALAFLVSCADMQEKPKETMGAILGAGVGALAGSQVGSGKGQMAAIAIGALAGAWAGGGVGKSLDRADRNYSQQTAQNALEYSRVGETRTWRNPDSGHSGSTKPVRTYQSASGANCREFESSILVDGKEEKAFGRACRQADGTWKIVQ